MLQRGTIFVGAIAIVFSLFAAAPLVAAAQSPIVPCGYASNAVDAQGQPINAAFKHDCGWADLVKLVGNITNYLIILGAAFSAVAFGWAGFLMMTAGGEMSKIEQAKSIFGKVLIGFLIMLSAWLIVHAIEAGFIKDSQFKSLLTPTTP
ncbi:MAG: hypothetical protein HYV67_01925 [Candidatus Taylorbacteria bacterium]|nr:hypothetical protein [Candidatus Taylorbacteria bacterium]